jgi:hypothetical protein
MSASTENPLQSKNFNYKPLRTGDYDEEIPGEANNQLTDRNEHDNNEEQAGDEEEGSLLKIQQHKRRQQQNELLQMLGNSMEKLSQMSTLISNEMESQNYSIRHLEVESEDIQHGSDELGQRQRRVQRSLFQENYYFCIFFMVTTVILIILIILKAYRDYWS